jgi:hypothetical protein
MLSGIGGPLWALFGLVVFLVEIAPFIKALCSEDFL